MLHLVFPDFRMTYDRDSGGVCTYYDKEQACSPVAVNDDHALHAARLGVQPGEYNLLHELAHHAVGIWVRKRRTSPTVHAAAVGKLPLRVVPDSPGALEEWWSTALTYYAFGCELERPNDYGALSDVARSTSVRALSDFLRHILLSARCRAVHTVIVNEELT